LLQHSLSFSPVAPHQTKVLLTVSLASFFRMLLHQLVGKPLTADSSKLHLMLQV
jgi:hypothetical protein